MKFVFFGAPLTSSSADHRSRILYTLLEGVAEKGHHLVYVEPESDGPPDVMPFVSSLRIQSVETSREAIDAEIEDASALIILSGFPWGTSGVEWLMEQAVPAMGFYDLDPWDTLGALDRDGAAAWITSDQIARLDIVFSIAGGPAVEAYRKRWKAAEALTLYETIDTAIYHPRSPEPDVSCDLAMVADRSAPAEAALEEYLLPAARELPSNRFVVAGVGWESSPNWPENVEVLIASSPADRATIYSSARLVLVPNAAKPIDYALSVEILEPAACAAACAVVDRPGLSDLFAPVDEVIVVNSEADLVPYLVGATDSELQLLGRNAEKRVLKDYVKLRIATKFEQRVARKFYIGHNG